MEFYPLTRTAQPDLAALLRGNGVFRSLGGGVQSMLAKKRSKRIEFVEDRSESNVKDNINPSDLGNAEAQPGGLSYGRVSIFV